MSPRLPALTPRDVIRTLERAGFFLHHTRGSHRYYRHPERPGLQVSVPHHPRDLPRGTIFGIIKRAGLTVEEFLALL